ncbi:MAG: hypothetical protein K8953_01065 [Proteobacteria bacterium]|nr:hypothetical protein [Pseudomonadota bacterium]
MASYIFELRVPEKIREGKTVDCLVQRFIHLEARLVCNQVKMRNYAAGFDDI